jgi:hydroxyacyl-ACP dehydratase HTD2-like protein with hotdog domain
MCHYIAFEATGGVDETMNRISDDWQGGAAFGELRADFHSPLEVGVEYHATGEVSNVDQKKGSTGELTIVTVSYELSTADDEPAYDMEADIILMEEQ